MEYFIAKTFAGLENELFKELHGLGAQNCRKLSRAVSFEGGISMMYRANYFCRTALRVLWRRKAFKFRNNNEFYKNVFDYDASEVLSPDGSLAFHTTASDSIFSTPLYASVLAKDAVCDRFRDAFDRRPDVDRESPDVQFHIHIYKDEAQLFLDSSGESLHKRGYKVRNHPAPINEVTAAALIKMTGWKADCDVIDPMCGGATLLIEAAMSALNIPAGFYRREFGFYRWKNFDRKLWSEIRNEAEIADDVSVNFYGSDIDARYLETARANVRQARLQDFVVLEREKFQHSSPERTPSLVIFNPPYGERLSVDDSASLYREIGDTLKNRYPGCRAFLISSDIDALKHVGLKPSKKWNVMNGSLECQFVGFELFSGDRKSFVIKQKGEK
ncbi:MAG: class I SAM-dependent RNA methyltransferase [Bacteroidales bacterium]|nr:class I SAM-dependent RNA methyltransferase [Bacteroidales bacterium]